MAPTPRAGDEFESGFARDATYGDLAVKVNSGNVSLSVADIEVGKVKLLDSGGVNVGAISAAGAQKVDGSAVTQPVSGPLTDAQLRALAVPVSGSFFQATQPVSLATNTPDVTDRAARLLGVLSAGANKVGTVDIATAPAVAKGTQGANGVPTQDLKDSGRVAVTVTGFQVAGIITTEAPFAASLVRAADGVVAAAAAQHTVTAGKRLRIQSIAVTVKNTAAAAGTSKLALRYRPGGGTVAITDSIIGILDIGSNNATAANYIGPYLMEIPDGFELVGGATFGFTNLSSAVTMLHTITVIGFEY